MRVWGGIAAVAAVAAVVAVLVAVLQVSGRESASERAEADQAQGEAEPVDAEAGLSWAEEHVLVVVEQHGSALFELEFELGRPVLDGSLVVGGDLGEVFGSSRLLLGALEPGLQSIALSVSAPRDAPPGSIFEGDLMLEDHEVGLGPAVDMSVDVLAIDVDRAVSELLLPSAARIGDRLEGDALADQLTVQHDGGVDVARELASEYGATLVGSAPDFGVFQFLVEAASDLSELVGLAEELSLDPRVGYAGPSMLAFHRGSDLVPAGRWDDEWGRGSQGATWHLEQVNALEAWERQTGIGSPPPIAVLDVGFDGRHQDLSFASVTGIERVPGGMDHGNMVAGVACADGTNGRGIVGVSWACELHVSNVSTSYYEVVEPERDDGMTSGWRHVQTDDYILKAMRRAATEGVRVANLSFGWPSPEHPQACTAWDDLPPDVRLAAEERMRFFASATAQARGLAEAAGHAEVLWVAAVNNGGCDTLFDIPPRMVAEVPAPFSTSLSDSWVAVAATDNTGGLASYSNHNGRLTVIAAPGGSDERPMESTSVCGSVTVGGVCYAYRDRTNGQAVAGTSYATPMVTGTAALMFAANPELTAAQARQCLVASTNGRGISHPHEDRLLPFGLLDTHAAVECAEGVTAELVLSDLLEAPVPSLCEHPAGVLVGGSLPGIPEGGGQVTLALSTEALAGEDPSSSLIAQGDLTGDGRVEIAIAAFCDRGGVRWPDSVLIYGPGPELLGVFEPWEHVDDWNNRGSVGVVEYLEGQAAVRVKWFTHREGDFAARASLPASATLRLSDNGISVDSVEVFDELPLVRRILAAAEGGDRATLLELVPENQIDLLLLMGAEGWDGEANCVGMTEWPSPWDASRVCTASIYDGASAVFLGLDLIGFGEWKVVEMASAG